VNQSKALTVNHHALVVALRHILGHQWPDFLVAAPKRGDSVKASHVFAEAVGISTTGSALDVAFGGIPALLLDLQRYEGAIEATLGSLGVDYRDRYRFQPGRRRILTLRQIHNRLRYAPYDSPLAIAKNDGVRPLSDAALVSMDVFEAIAKIPHPSRPLSPAQRAERQAEQVKKDEALAGYKKRRSAEQDRRSGLEKAKANAQEARKVAHA
jgi:hypothetical protein